MDETFDGLAEFPTSSVDEPNGASEFNIQKWTADQRAQLQLTLHRGGWEQADARVQLDRSFDGLRVVKLHDHSGRDMVKRQKTIGFPTNLEVVVKGNQVATLQFVAFDRLPFDEGMGRSTNKYDGFFQPDRGVEQATGLWVTDDTCLLYTSDAADE